MAATRSNKKNQEIESQSAKGKGGKEQAKKNKTTASSAADQKAIPSKVNPSTLSNATSRSNPTSTRHSNSSIQPFNTMKSNSNSNQKSKSNMSKPSSKQHPHLSPPPPSSSPQGISLYLANAKKAREQFGRNSSSSPNPLFKHLLPQEDDSLSLSIRPDSPQPRVAEDDDDGDSSMIEYVDESLMVPGKNVSARVESEAGEEDNQYSVDEEEDQDKENHPSQLSMRPTTPTSRPPKDDQPNHSTPIPPQHSTPVVVGGIRPQRSAGPRSALRPLELEGVSLSTQSKPKSFLDEAMDLSDHSQQSDALLPPPSSQRKRLTIAQIRTAAHAREQAQLVAERKAGGYWEGDREMNRDSSDEDDEDDDEGEKENEEDPFGFFASLKARKRKSNEQLESERNGKKAHTSNDEGVVEGDKPGSSPDSNLGLEETMEPEGGRKSSKTSDATHQLKSAPTPTSPDLQQRDPASVFQSSSTNSSPASLPSAGELMKAGGTSKGKESASRPENKAKSPSPTRSSSPSTSELARGSNLNSEAPSQQSGVDGPPSSPIFDVVLPPRDGKKARANAPATKSKGKTVARKTRGRGKGKGKETDQEGDGEQSTLKVDDLVGLLPGRKGRTRTLDSLSPPPGSREAGRSKSGAKSKAKSATNASKKKKKSSKKQASSDDEDDEIFTSSEKDQDKEMDESWIGNAAGKRIPLKSKPTNSASKKGKNMTNKKPTSSASKSVNKKASSSTSARSTSKKASVPSKKSDPKLPSRSSKRGRDEEIRVMVIIERSDGESNTEEEDEEEEEIGSADEDGSKRNVESSKKRSTVSQSSKKKRIPNKTSKAKDSGSEEEEETLTSDPPEIKEARNKRLKSYDALNDYKLFEEKVLF